MSRKICKPSPFLAEINTATLKIHLFEFIEEPLQVWIFSEF